MARALGLTEPRITQITALLGLAPAAQEAVLLGQGGVGIREAIRAARGVEWVKQGAHPQVNGLLGARSAAN